MRKNSVYDRMQSLNGNVDVLGDAAIRVNAPTNPVQYRETDYTIAEEVNLGLGGRVEVPAAPSTTLSSTLQLPTPNTSLPFMTQRVTIPSSVALFLMLSQAKIAAIDLIDGEAICADVFSEVSLNNGVRGPTAQTGQQIGITIQNTDPSSAHEPRVTLTGVRLRP